MPCLTRVRVTAAVIAAAAAAMLIPAGWKAVAPKRIVYRASYTVQIEAAGPIREAGGEVCSDRAAADRIVERRQPKDCDRIAEPLTDPTDWFLRASAVCVQEQSWFGRDESYSQDRYLAVVAVLADGRRVAKAVELPDARASRHVTVRLDAPAAP